MSFSDGENFNSTFNLIEDFVGFELKRDCGEMQFVLNQSQKRSRKLLPIRVDACHPGGSSMFEDELAATGSVTIL